MVHDDSHMFVLNAKKKLEEHVAIEEDIKEKIKEYLNLENLFL